MHPGKRCAGRATSQSSSILSEMEIFAILIKILDFRGKLIKNRKARVRALGFFWQPFEEKIS
jgi:hypothetical protein